MKLATREHEVEWLTPAPLWGTSADPRAPAVVRLDGDDFMDRFTLILAGQRAGAELLAARPGVEHDGKEANKLYQSLHGCYAIVCASLTCRAAGRPEKAVAPARGDSVAFVLRRVEESETGKTESAWVPAGAGEGAWVQTAGAALVEGEELIPLFPVPVGSSVRRVWAGVVPTASRETYKPADLPASDPDAKDGRVLELEAPLGALATRIEVPPVSDPNHDTIQKAADETALQAALGLAEFVNTYVVPAEHAANLLAVLNGNGVGQKLREVPGLTQAMTNAWGRRGELIGTEERTAGYPGPTGGLVLPVDEDDVKKVRDAVTVLFPHPEPARPEPNNAPRPKFAIAFYPGEPPRRYVIRCVYVRRNCPAVASAPSAEFTIAPVHDPSAPARTIRIPMPVDTSIAGLRKFKKKVGFLLSPMLNAQVQSLSGKKLKDIDEGNVEAGGIDLGEICSFALPIITLCAMIVLFIFLVLLNIVFFWLPLLKICLPIPKGKSS